MDGTILTSFEDLAETAIDMYICYYHSMWTHINVHSNAKKLVFQLYLTSTVNSFLVISYISAKLILLNSLEKNIYFMFPSISFVSNPCNLVYINIPASFAILLTNYLTIFFLNYWHGLWSCWVAMFPFIINVFCISFWAIFLYCIKIQQLKHIVFDKCHCLKNDILFRIFTVNAVFHWIEMRRILEFLRIFKYNLIKIITPIVLREDYLKTLSWNMETQTKRLSNKSYTYAKQRSEWHVIIKIPCSFWAANNR